MTTLRRCTAVLGMGLYLVMTCALSSPGATAEGTLSPWRKGDFIFTDQVVDDRPNEASRAVVTERFTPLVSERFFLGENRAGA